jgi:hypothetical protein
MCGKKYLDATHMKKLDIDKICDKTYLLKKICDTNYLLTRFEVRSISSQYTRGELSADTICGKNFLLTRFVSIIICC